MGRRERIVALAVKENELERQLAEVRAELDSLLSNKKKGKKRTDKAGRNLTPEQRELFSTGPLAQRVRGVLEIHAGESLSVEQIASLIRADNGNSVRGILSRLKASGVVKSSARGQYTIAAATEDEQ